MPKVKPCIPQIKKTCVYLRKRWFSPQKVRYCRQKRPLFCRRRATTEMYTQCAGRGNHRVLWKAMARQAEEVLFACSWQKMSGGKQKLELPCRGREKVLLVLWLASPSWYLICSGKANQPWSLSNWSCINPTSANTYPQQTERAAGEPTQWARKSNL